MAAVRLEWSTRSIATAVAVSVCTAWKADWTEPVLLSISYVLRKRSVPDAFKGNAHHFRTQGQAALAAAARSCLEEWLRRRVNRPEAYGAARASIQRNHLGRSITVRQSRLGRGKRHQQ